MSDSTFAILISTKNRKSDILYTLSSLAGICQSPNVKCVVFDDGSTDGTFEAVRHNFPLVTLMRNETSKGYMYCRNTMLNETTADYAISLDDDANFLSEDPLGEIAGYFSKNPRCGLMAFRIFWGKSLPDDTATNEVPHVVNGFVGCGHAWRMTSWRNVRSYPEWFEFYGEEKFGALEMFRLGIEVHYTPQVLVHHRVDMSVRKAGADAMRRYRLSIRADWYLYFMFFPPMAIARRLSYSIWMQLKKIARGRTDIIWPLLQAIGDLILNIPRSLRNRRAFSTADYNRFLNLRSGVVYWKPDQRESN